MIELERMRVNMDEMERERAQMVAEVEAQIEKALQSMAFSDGVSISDSSRPGSVFSTRPNSPSVNSVGRPVRSFGTASTLAGDEDVKSGDDKNLAEASEDITAVHPTSDGEPLTEVRLRKFSATHMDSTTDGLKGMDHGITEKSDQVAQKVLQIQQKLETALAETKKRRSGSTSSQSASEKPRQSSEEVPPMPNPRPVRSRPPRPLRLVESPPVTKARMTPTPTSENFKDRKISSPVLESEEETEVLREGRSSVRGMHKIASGGSLRTARGAASAGRRTPTSASTQPPLTPAVTTDDSDDSYQSAYSAVSPQHGDFLTMGGSESDVEVGYERPSAAVHSHAALHHHDPMSDFGLRRIGKSALDITLRPPTRERTMSTSTATTKTITPTASTISNSAIGKTAVSTHARPSRRYREVSNVPASHF